MFTLLERIRYAIAAGRQEWKRTAGQPSASKPPTTAAAQDWAFGQRPHGRSRQEYNESLERWARRRR